MGDSRLRELERRWRETSSIDDEVAYLAERVRIGGLTTMALELAALLGQVAALQLVARRTSTTEIPPLPTLADLARVTELDADNRPPRWIVRVHQLGGDGILRRLAVRTPRSSSRISGEVLDAIDVWNRDPTDERFQACRRLLPNDAAMNREAIKLVVTWGGVPVADRAVVEATCRVMFLAFVPDENLLRTAVVGACVVKAEHVLT